ncbi:hypothetical protein CRH09_18630 [Nocardia terpenica]|uniref:Uncharacterized protein n=1 Tax=Nocardia terpenica TaxID=455432 RepID=A0A291RKX1_9NOCA|nr:hypothetical protein CRH09_18630 [Nocardia terpenica]
MVAAGDAYGEDVSDGSEIGQIGVECQVIRQREFVQIYPSIDDLPPFAGAAPAYSSNTLDHTE